LVPRDLRAKILDYFHDSALSAHSGVAKTFHRIPKVFWERALANLKRARDRVARRYNAMRSEAVFWVGDLVLVKLHPQSSKALKRSAKIENKWSDPPLITRFLTNVTVQLANPDTGVIV
jgi:hypothetical protein